MSEPPATTPATPPDTASMLVDLRRCIGCHACSVACKTEHSLPLGEFRMRVRWQQRPDRLTLAFLPVFDADSCDFGRNRRSAGLQPACVAACPTGALVFDESGSDPAAPGDQPLAASVPTRAGVRYRGLEPWQAGAIGAGAALSSDDDEIIYER